MADGDGKQQQICSSFFSKLLKINRSTLFRAIRSAEKNPTAVERRGKYPTRRIDTRDIQFLKAFIEKFPTFESGRNYKYLHPNLRLNKLYDIYSDQCETNVLKKSTFWKIFKRDFNLRFFRRTQKCEICENMKKQTKSFVLSQNTKHQIEQKNQKHLKRAKNVKRYFERRVTEAVDSLNGLEVLTFGFQRSQEIPSIVPSESMQLRPFWCHNFCIYDEVRKRCHIYVWDEATASKGSAEIASCLYRHFFNNLPEGTRNIILFSDPSYGQNRNDKLTMMLHNFFVNESDVELQQMQFYFFTTGHSYNNCNRIFDKIQKQRRDFPNLFVPNDWLDVIRQTNTSSVKIDTIEMKTEDFYKGEKLGAVIVTDEVTSEMMKYPWQKCKSFTFTRDDPYVLQIQQYDANKIYIPLRLENVSEDFPQVRKNILGQCTHPISKEKFEDLNSLLEFIPEQHHQFYTSLEHTTNSDLRKDYALASRQLSDENTDSE